MQIPRIMLIYNCNKFQRIPVITTITFIIDYGFQKRDINTYIYPKRIIFIKNQCKILSRNNKFTHNQLKIHQQTQHNNIKNILYGQLKTTQYTVYDWQQTLQSQLFLYLLLINLQKIVQKIILTKEYESQFFLLQQYITRGLIQQHNIVTCLLFFVKTKKVILKDQIMIRNFKPNIQLIHIRLLNISFEHFPLTTAFRILSFLFSLFFLLYLINKEKNKHKLNFNKYLDKQIIEQKIFFRHKGQKIQVRSQARTQPTIRTKSNFFYQVVVINITLPFNMTIHYFYCFSNFSFFVFFPFFIILNRERKKQTQAQFQKTYQIPRQTNN
eukprot:TRINITY_DN10358_c0_g1_i2.p1 TRINITY_DN10358_c0_g1~~TRINITY_DN10358_c0_g1_i2.p1  ORF type:complete len:326 (+),score=-29.82 TRINITY_DN10358_c0_g1_i2:66-1043(+)